VHRLQDTPTAHNAWQIMVNHAQAANHVIMPSRHFADKFRDHGVTRPMSVISNGIKDDVIARLPTKKRRASRKKTPFKVMWCGRVSQDKRPIDSIRAIAKLKNCTLDIYGDGPMLGEVKKYVHAHGLKDRVRVLGRVEQVEILDAMQTHDVLLYPSYGFDNQPMVLIEAVAAAIPIIYCDPDLTECMPEAGGLLTDDASIDAISLALSEVQHEPNRWQKMHETLFAYRGKVAQSYHSKKMAATYKKIISGR
jgi:glycosyltransferase involved in cell wall biosynthesis